RTFCWAADSPCRNLTVHHECIDVPMKRISPRHRNDSAGVVGSLRTRWYLREPQCRTAQSCADTNCDVCGVSSQSTQAISSSLRNNNGYWRIKGRWLDRGPHDSTEM